MYLYCGGIRSESELNLKTVRVRGTVWTEAAMLMLTETSVPVAEETQVWKRVKRSESQTA